MDTILHPIMVVVAWIMVQFHWLFSLVLDPQSGLSWALSIVGLVIIMRIVLIPLFVKQIKAARGMQMLSPELQALQKKYKGRSDPASREAMTRETMDLYKKHGTNPFASCLPMLAQSPIFFALFRVLINIPKVGDGTYQSPSIGPLTKSLAHDFSQATLFGARLSDVFLRSDTTSVKIVAAALIVLMSATTFTTQRQLTQKNMPAAALQGPMAQQQKMLLYALPLVFAFSGVNFPIGVLIYWSTTNFWSMGQQFYVIRRNPTPGSEAERLFKERRAKKAAARGIVLEDEPTEPEKPKGQRQQPVRKARTRPPGTATTAERGKPAGSGRQTPGQAQGSTGSTGGAGKASSGASKVRSPGTAGRTATGAKGSAAGAGKARPVSGAAKGTSGAAKGGAKAGGSGRPGERSAAPDPGRRRPADSSTPATEDQDATAGSPQPDTQDEQ
jgi:YidC/Oxa1 family membrane protein insertase